MRKRPMGGAETGGAEHERQSKIDRPSDPAPVSNTALSAPRPRAPEPLPSAWLDHLLAATLDLPYSSGERAVVEAVVTAVATILPSYAVGACIVLDQGTNRREPVVFRRMPQAGAPPPRGVDAARVFPEFEHEQIVPVQASPPGSTLHVASDDDDLDIESSAAVQVLARAALVLRRALPNARAWASASVTASRSARHFEKKMMHADKLATFGQLAAGVVHELNNPLTSIVAYSEALLRRAAAGALGPHPEDVERLARIQESANRLLRFTRELVTYARPSGEQAGPVALHPVIDRAIAFCEHVLASSGVAVERRYAGEVECVRGVSEQLVQVFVNLLTNACHAAPARGGRVVISTVLRASEGEARATVIVADNGRGIAPEHVPQVFVPFFTTKRHAHGTGLGLSIVKSIIDSHDGDIRVESQVGRGTEFVVELPVTTPA